MAYVKRANLVTFLKQNPCNLGARSLGLKCLGIRMSTRLLSTRISGSIVSKLLRDCALPQMDEVAKMRQFTIVLYDTGAETAGGFWACVFLTMRVRRSL